MNNLELVDNRGIIRKSRGVKERGEMRLEINRGAKVQKMKISGVKLTSRPGASRRSPGGSGIASR